MELKTQHLELNRNKMIIKMNKLGKERKAFLFIINYGADKGFVWSDEEIDSDFVKFSFHAQGSSSQLSQKSSLQWQTRPVSYSYYNKAFSFVQDEIRKGNSFLVNLTQPTEVETNLTLIEIFENAHASYKLWLNNKFTVLSPECFVKIENGQISSFPMKGTIDAQIPGAENIILNDIKEKAEHATIVDLIRNDLSMVATEVKVKRYRYVDCLKTNKGDLLQISSEISGRLPNDFHKHLGDIIFTLLPAGSISGAPKRKTLEIIEKAENYDRDYYTGVFGYFDGSKLDSAVMIRFTEKKQSGLVFKSGGGITSLSESDKEYEELLRKVYVPIY